jgi:hypothetical protein
LDRQLPIKVIQLQKKKIQLQRKKGHLLNQFSPLNRKDSPALSVFLDSMSRSNEFGSFPCSNLPIALGLGPDLLRMTSILINSTIVF